MEGRPFWDGRTGGYCSKLRFWIVRKNTDGLPAPRHDNGGMSLEPSPSAAIEHVVFNTLQGAHATLERSALLGDNMAVAVWRRHIDEVETVYQQPGHHTLSCYLDGGFRTERQEAPGLYGAPRRMCTLPDDHESRWRVRGELRFLHVYFLPEHFTRKAVLECEREPREVTLSDRTFFEDEQLSYWCNALCAMAWDGVDARLRANEAAHALISALLRSQGVLRKGAPSRGGLSPVVRQRVVDWIEAHLGNKSMTLGELAALACLSEYHFVRMFRMSCGLPPHAWIAGRRIDRAKGLLRAGAWSLQRVAEACGYADQSHFCHRFRAATGVSPGQYRRLFSNS